MRKYQFPKTRTRTDNIPYGTEVSAAGLSGCACVACNEVKVKKEVRREGGKSKAAGQAQKNKALQWVGVCCEAF